ncbi:MAG: GatB/YqeY domain-containing protein [Hyphomicrobiaceae bacterium]
MVRDRISQALKDAMKAGEKRRVATLRLVTAAIKDRDLGIGGGPAPESGKISDEEVLQLLTKMVKQRRESIETYSSAGRDDLVDQETAEIAVIEEFMPRQMGEAEIRAAIEGVMRDLSCESLKDMGRVMAALKTRYPGQMDFGKASGLVKELLQ